MHHSLDIVEGGDSTPDPRAGNRPNPADRPAIGVYFRCANLYQRVYKGHNDQYLARCARCGKTIRFVVGRGGDPRRQFEVSC